MIHVVIKEGDRILGEMRLEDLSPSSPDRKDYSVEFAADSGGDWVDSKRRMLYGFNSAKYNYLALVSEALNLLEFNEMEWTDAENRPGRMARRQRRGSQALPRKADDPERDH